MAWVDALEAVDPAMAAALRRIEPALADMRDARRERETGRPLFPDRPMSRYDYQRITRRNDAPAEEEPDWDSDDWGAWGE